MRVVAVTYGTEGDWRPLAALCSGLARAGHDVTMLAPRPAEALARRLGVAFDALAGDMAAELDHAMPTLMHKGLDPAAMSRILTGMAARNTSAWMRTVLAHARGADVIVPAGLAVYVGLSCAEHLGVRAVGAGLQPVMPTRAFPSPFVPPWRMPGWLNRMSHRVVLALLWRAFRAATNAAREEVGQSARRAPWDGYPILFGYSPTLVPAPADWPARFHVTGAWTTVPDPAWRPAAALEMFLAAGEAPVYVGFGSMQGFDRARAEAAVIGALDGRRAIMSAGAARLGQGALPGHVLRVGPVPHPWLFPRMRVVMHHGGAGTTHAAARAGVPQVVVPLTGDQPFWGDRVWRLGIASRPLAHRALTASALRTRLDEAGDGAHATRAAAIADAMRDEDGVGNAVAAFTAAAAAV